MKRNRSQLLRLRVRCNAPISLPFSRRRSTNLRLGHLVERGLAARRRRVRQQPMADDRFFIVASNGAGDVGERCHVLFLPAFSVRLLACPLLSEGRKQEEKCAGGGGLRARKKENECKRNVKLKRVLM